MKCAVKFKDFLFFRYWNFSLAFAFFLSLSLSIYWTVLVSGWIRLFFFWLVICCLLNKKYEFWSSGKEKKILKTDIWFFWLVFETHIRTDTQWHVCGQLNLIDWSLWMTYLVIFVSLGSFLFFQFFLPDSLLRWQ